MANIQRKSIWIRYFSRLSSIISYFIDMAWCAYCVMWHQFNPFVYTIWYGLQNVFVSLFFPFSRLLLLLLLPRENVLIKSLLWAWPMTNSIEHLWLRCCWRMKHNKKKNNAKREARTRRLTHFDLIVCGKISLSFRTTKTAVRNFYMRNWISLLIHFGNVLCAVTSRRNFHFSNQIWSKWLAIKEKSKDCFFLITHGQCNAKKKKRNFCTSLPIM